jgi:hypothetical protein
MQIHNLVGTSRIARQQSAVAIAEVRLPSGGRTFYASANGGKLNPAQREMLSKLGIPEENILWGAKVTKGFSKVENHAERIIERNLPMGAVGERWGISWTTPRKPIPCLNCKPVVLKTGGAWELNSQ